MYLLQVDSNFFVKNWQKVTTDLLTMSYVEGYKIDLLEIPSQNSSPLLVSMKEEKNMIVQEEIEEVLKKKSMIRKLSYSAVAVLPAPLHYRSLQRQEKILFISGGQERSDLVRKQPKIEQCEITSEFKTSNNYSIRCITERLRNLLAGLEDWGPWSKLETKEYCQNGAHPQKGF